MYNLILHIKLYIYLYFLHFKIAPYGITIINKLTHITKKRNTENIIFDL